jgi:WD40 repeat protein
MVLEHRDWANSAEFTADGRLLVTTSDDKTAQVWEVESGSRFGNAIQRSEMIQYACFSPDGQRVLTAGSNVDGQLWVLGQSAVGSIGSLTHRDNVPFGSFSPDGRWAGTASFDGTACVWDAHNGDVVCQMRHHDRVRFVQFSSDGLRCLTASEDGTARIWDSQTGQPVTEPMRHTATVWCARFSPDGRLVATASADGTVQLWDVRSQNALVLPLPLDNRTPQTATWSADSRRVATAGSLAAVWDARSGVRFAVGYHWHGRGILVSRLDASGDHVLIGLENGIAQIWSVTNAVGPEIEIHHQGPITVLAFSSDGSRFLSASTDGCARLWHRASGEPATPFLRHGAPIKVATLSPNGNDLLTGATDGRCLLWDASTGDLTTTLADHLGPILDGRFSDDGQLAITASEDHTARLWEIPGGAPLGGPLRHLGPVHSVDLTRDAKWAVTASEDKTARVWEVMTSQPMGMIVRHEAALVHAEFDPTDTWFLTASKDGVVRISEVATGHPVCEFAQPGHSLRQATFSPDGKWVLIASDGWATIRRVLRHSGPIPEWLPMLGEAVAQQRLTAEGQSEAVPAAALLELKQHLQTLPAPDEPSTAVGASGRPAHLPTANRPTNPKSAIRNPKYPLDPWESWFFGNPLERSFAPDAAISAAELAERLLEHTSSIYVVEDRLDLLKAAFALDPANAAAFAQLTFCRAALDISNFDRTLPMLDWYSREALRLSPEGPRSWWARAIYLERCGRLDEAAKAMERARALGLPEASFHLSAAAFLVREGRLDEAGNAVAQAHELLEADADAMRRVDCRRALCAWAMDLAQRNAFPGARSFALRTCGIADRPPETPLRCLDLTAFYNAPIDLPWIGRRVHHWDLKDLPKGAITMSETDFDVRGVVQLSRGSWTHFFRDDEWSRFYRVGIFGVQTEAAFRFEWPQQVSGIPVGQPCRRLHLLLGTHDQEPDGLLIANVTVHYADGQTDAIPIEYGTHIREWIVEALETLPEPDPQAAWTHRTHLGDVLQLFIRSWENPRPDVALDRLDLESTMTESAPFVVAITLDP